MLLWMMVGALVIVLYILAQAIGSAFGIYNDRLLMILVMLVSGGLAIYVLSVMGAIDKRLKSMEAKLDDLLQRGS